MAVSEILPSGWASAVDPLCDRIYYFNRGTKVRSWEKPTELVSSAAAPAASAEDLQSPDWEEYCTASGRSYFFHRGRGEVCWKLPPGGRAVAAKRCSMRAAAPAVAADDEQPAKKLRTSVEPPSGHPAATGHVEPPATPAARPVGVAPSIGNTVLADIFEEMAAVQKIKRDRFRSRAYEKAALALRAHPEPILSGAQAKAIEGIGAGMARRIDVVLETGELEELKELKRDSDVLALRDLRSVHGIGAVRAAELIEKGIRTVDDLREAVASGHVHLDAVQQIGLRHVSDFVKKIPRKEMVEHEAFLGRIQAERHPKLKLLVCGSYRRGKSESGDIDVLITSSEFTSTHTEANASGVMLKSFIQSLRDASYITDDLAAGSTKYMGACRLPGHGHLHRRIDVRCVPSDQFCFGSLYFTGSATLSVRLRMRAIELGMTLSEYGLENKESGEKVVCATEEDVFKALGWRYLEPWER
mmetsp:Transcript_142626/g.248705  ORF Transcript_142626/g.248705 Transcript_142626/m.248705 type:complete len:471 (-) Transcript_142626:81-1493(-)